MDYTLYYNPDSANLVVRMILEELRLAYQDVQAPRKRSERPPEFFALNPRGLLPVLVDHGTGDAISETGAIALYLADKHGRLAPTPTAFEDRGSCLRCLFMISNTLHADLALQFYSERYANHQDDAERIKTAASQRVLGHLDMLNQLLEQTRSDWLLPSGLSICDFYLGCCVRWAQLYPSSGGALQPEQITSFAALTALLRRAERLASVQSALSKEVIVGPAFLGPISPLAPRAPDGVGAAS